MYSLLSDAKPGAQNQNLTAKLSGWVCSHLVATPYLRTTTCHANQVSLKGGDWSELSPRKDSSTASDNTVDLDHIEMYSLDAEKFNKCSLI